MKALERGIPIFTFVDSKVWHDHSVYEKNKDKAFLKDIVFPSIDKMETAKYIFEFINFIRHLTDNNSVQSFTRVDDIDTYLKKQWSGLFQRLLFETKIKVVEDRKLEFISGQISDIKTALISSISNDDLKEAAKGAIKFRRIIDVIRAFQYDDTLNLVNKELSWEELLEKLGVAKIDSVKDYRRQFTTGMRMAFIMQDETFYISRLNYNILSQIFRDWADFEKLDIPKRVAIFKAVSDVTSFMPLLEKVDQNFLEFVKKGEEQQAWREVSTLDLTTDIGDDPH